MFSCRGECLVFFGHVCEKMGHLGGFKRPASDPVLPKFESDKNRLKDDFCCVVTLSDWDTPICGEYYFFLSYRLSSFSPNITFFVL